MSNSSKKFLGQGAYGKVVKGRKQEFNDYEFQKIYRGFKRRLIVFGMVKNWVYGGSESG